jgi:hypothetical protein
MVHRNYLIQLFVDLIDQDQPVPVVHAISEKHISRKVFYEQAAQEYGLEPPQFEDDVESVGKVVCVS